MSRVPRPVTRVARGATYLFFQGIATSVIGLVYFFMLVRLLPPPPNPEMGIYAIITFIHTLASIFGTFALGTAAVKYIAQYIGEGDIKKARSVVARLLQIFLMTSIALSTALFVSAKWLSVVITGTSTWAPLFQVLALVSFFTIIGSSFVCLQGLQRIREVAILNMTYTAAEKSIAIYLLYAGMGLYSVVYGLLAGFIVATLMGLILTARFLGVFEKPHPVKPLISFSYPLYISNILGLASGWVDRLLILPYMSSASLGIYHVAVKAATVPELVSTSIVTALFPQLSELHAREGKDTLRQAFHFSTRVVLVGFPAMLGLAALSKPVILLFAGANYADAVLPLTIICFAALPGTLGIAISPTLLTLERTKTVLKITVASIIANTVVSYVTLAHLNLGIIGPAWARVFASVTSFGLGVYALRRDLRVTFDKEAFWKASVASILMAMVVVFLQRLIFNLYLLPIYMTVGVAVYFLSLVTLKAIKKSDVERLRDYLPSKLRWVTFWLDRVAVVG